MHAGPADKRSAMKPSLTKLGSWHQSQRAPNKAKATPLKVQADPEYPPGFHPAVRRRSVLEFPGLATESNKTHPSAENSRASTPAMHRLSLSPSTAKIPPTTSPPTSSNVPTQTIPPPPGLPHPARTASAADVTGSAKAGATSPLPTAEDDLKAARPELPIHTHTTILRPVKAPQVARQQLSHPTGTSSQACGFNQQPEQPARDCPSPQLHQSPQQSGWDCDSNSEPAGAWIVGGCNQGSQRQQDTEASRPRGCWRPNQYQGAAAKLAGLQVAYTLHKPQQQHRHGARQFSPGFYARSSGPDSKGETEQHQKTLNHVGGWHPEQYQGTAAPAYSVDDAKTEESPRQHHSTLLDTSLQSLLPYAFPKAFTAHNTSETQRPSSLPAPMDPDPDPSNNRYPQPHSGSSASSRQKPDPGGNPNEHHDHVQPPLPAQEACHMQSQKQQSWDDSSHNRPRTPSTLAGGFGLHPSKQATSSQGSRALSPTHPCHSSVSEADSVHSSSAKHASSMCVNHNPDVHDNQQQQPALSANPSVHDQPADLTTQHNQDSDEHEGGDPSCNPQPLEDSQASWVSIAATGPKPGRQQQYQAGKGGKGQALSKTGKVINPNDVSIRLNPCSPFYDAQLAMCWRVLTRQDKRDWQTRLAKGKRMKLAGLAQPRQQLAKQLHPGHPQYCAATAAAWKNEDAAAKENILRSADHTGEAIKLLPDEPRPTTAAEPVFHEADFPALGLPKTHTQHGGSLYETASSHGSLQNAARLPHSTGLFGREACITIYVAACELDSCV